jgi:ribosomal protein S18 acetylase RimI-like enzyme
MMIRSAQESDAPQLAELITQLGYPTSAVEMAGRMEVISRDETFATFVAAEGNDVAGMIGVSDCPSYEHNDRNGRIIALVVRADMRRRGLGHELVRFAEHYLAQKKVGRIVLTSRFTREDAHKFYESLGYARTGLRFMKELAVR